MIKFINVIAGAALLLSAPASAQTFANRFDPSKIITEVTGGKCDVHDLADLSADNVLKSSLNLPKLPAGISITESQVFSAVEMITGRSMDGYHIPGICTCDDEAQSSPTPQQDNPPAPQDNEPPTGSGGGGKSKGGKL